MNQVKSDYLFLRMNIDENGVISFNPSEHRIKEWCNMVDSYKDSINFKAAKTTENLLEDTKIRKKTMNRINKVNKVNKLNKYIITRISL